MFFALAALLGAAPCNIHPVYSLVPVVSTVKVTHAGAHYRASAAIKFTVRETVPAVIASVEPGAIEHARGHAVIAQRVGRSASGHVEGLGANEGQARAHLKRAIANLADDQNRELAREEHDYDAVTANGAQQSQGPAFGLPGGPDVQDAACTR